MANLDKAVHEIVNVRMQFAPEGVKCAYCETQKSAGNRFFPPHDASSRCESGKHNHCSCDTCF